MITWDAEPYWDTLDRLQAVYQVAAFDTLVVAVREYALTPRPPVERHYKGLDRIKSLRAQGIIGVIVR